MKRMWTEREVRSLAVKSVEETSNLKVFENIVDKDGHKRFIEGDIAIETISGVTKTYGKWSLSGSHLMIALVLSLANTTTIAGTTKLGALTLPKWIYDKIIPAYSAVVELKSTPAYGSDSTSQSFAYYGRKNTDNEIGIYKSGDITLTADRSVRLQFDLLIDDE